jgi:hypothetical protein
MDEDWLDAIESLVNKDWLDAAVSVVMVIDKDDMVAVEEAELLKLSRESELLVPDEVLTISG